MVTQRSWPIPPTRHCTRSRSKACYSSSAWHTRPTGSSRNGNALQKAEALLTTKWCVIWVSEGQRLRSRTFDDVHDAVECMLGILDNEEPVSMEIKQVKELS